MRLLSLPTRQPGPHGLLSLALLVVTLACVTLGLADAVRELDAPLVLVVAMLGLLVGWILANSPLCGWIALVIASILGLAGVFVRVGRLDGKLVVLFQALAGRVREAFRWLSCIGDMGSLRQGPALNWEPVLLVLGELRTGGGALLARVRAWAVALAAGEPTFDPVATALMWGLALWAVSAWAGWTARRHARPLQAVAPAGTLLLVTFRYREEAHTLLPVVLGAVLLLLASLTRDASIRRWRTAGFDPIDDGGRTTRVVVVLALALVVTAATVPSLSVRQIVELVRDRNEERDAADDLAESLGVERPPKPVPEEIAVFDQVRTAGLARRHLVGSGPELSDQRVMTVRTDDPLPVLEAQEVVELGERDELPSVPRYYWRDRTYDLYVYFGWYTGDTEIIEYRAGELAITATVGLTLPRRIVRQEVQVIGDLQGMIYVAGALVSVDQDYNVAWRSPGDMFAATTRETAYRAVSTLPLFTVERLRAAGTDYPDWVQSHYLWLPDTVPERVLALARDLTAIAPTPYDRAAVIETYLRTFSYDLDVPTPPSDRDVADYFLFELQEGYCDYFATAMVVMARAAGVPARYVTGYATGTYDYTQGRYVVVEANAHSWAEVYFPGYGWVEFEPTAGLPAIERPTEGDVETFEPPSKPPGLEEATTRPWWSEVNWPWWLTGMAGLAVLALVGVVWMTVDTWWLRRLSSAAAVTTLYRRLRRQARRLAVPVQVSDTPYEFVVALAEWAANLSREEYWDEWLVPAVQGGRCLIDYYVKTIYASRPLTPWVQRRAIETWRKLHWHLWLAHVRRSRLFGRRLFD
jgi:transglutaminase-like putative cysteine protease